MRPVVERTSVALWAAAFFFCLMLVALVGARYIIQPQNNAASLAELGRKEYLDPGKLLYCESGPQGIWTVHQMEHEVILSFTDSSGSKRWLTKFPAAGLLLDTNRYFTAVGLADGQVSVLDWQGLTVWQEDAQMPLLSLEVNDNGEVIANFDTKTDEVGWGTTLTLLSPDGLKAWEQELVNAQMLTAAWSDTAVAVATYKATQAEQGVELIVYTKSSGEELFRSYLGDQPLTGLSFNRSGSKILVALSNKVMVVDASSGQTTSFKQKGAVSVLSSQDEGFYLLVHKRLLWKQQSQVLYMSAQNDIHQAAVLKGRPLSWEQDANGRLLIVTDAAVSGVGTAGTIWQVGKKEEPLDAAVDLLEGTVFVYTREDVLLWYK